MWECLNTCQGLEKEHPSALSFRVGEPWRVNLAKQEVPLAPASSAGSALGAACSSCSSLTALGSTQHLRVVAGRNCGLGQFTVLVGTGRD